MASSVCCVRAELLCSLQLLTRLAPAEGFNKLSKYLFLGNLWGPGVGNQVSWEDEGFKIHFPDGFVWV